MSVQFHTRLPLLVLFLALGGCLQEEPSEGDCPAAQPAFELNISAGGEPLPAGTLLRVTYNAGEEAHFLGETIAGPAVFCDWVSGDRVASASEGSSGGVSGASQTWLELHCDLWTAGPATLEIEAPGFVTIRRDLKPDQDECGVRTNSQAVELERPDAELSE